MKETHSAGGVVLGPGGCVLVVNQRGTTWSLPKGHVDSGEDAQAAARREIDEESGVTELELIEPLGVYVRHRIALDGGDDPSERKTIHMFLFRTAQQKLAPRDLLNPEARWVRPEEVCALLTHRRDREFFQSQLPRIRSALCR